MKEMLLKFVESSMFDSFLTWVFGLLVAFIVGKAVPQFKFQIKKAEKKYREVMPDWLEPLFDKMAKKAQEELLKELLKHAQGQEGNVPTALKKRLKEIVDVATVTRETNLKENMKAIVVEKATEVAKAVGVDLLERAKMEIIETEGAPSCKEFTMNKQVVSIIDKLKDLPENKNHMYAVYAELEKKKNEELEGRLGATVGGRF